MESRIHMRLSRIFLLVCLGLVLWSGLIVPVRALEPPDRAEAEKIRKILALKGPLSAAQVTELADIKRRMQNARNLGNYRIDTTLLSRALQRAAKQNKGPNPSLARPQVLPLRRQGMPTTGDVRIFALLLDFSDYPARSSRDFVQSSLFGTGVSSRAPQESLSKYYERASYGQLNLANGSTLGWYRPNRPRSEIEQTAQGREALIAEALKHFDAQGHDFSQYDNNGDGVIDYFVVIWAGPNNGWSNFWWGYQTRYLTPSFKLDGVSLGKYSWQWESRNNNSTFNPATVIHETGHALGLPDYYDYDDAVGPRGGVGAMDIMHSQRGDHNCFSKWVLDWVNPTVISTGSQTLNLQASGDSRDCVLAWPQADTSTPFSEFFMIQNRTRIGNDTNMPGDGLLVWHVDASLNEDGTDYAFDNSYTDHKLIRLMEADGLEQIEQGGTGDGGDYYRSGKRLDTISTPNSQRYGGPVSGVSLTNISAPAHSMQATIAIGPQDTLQVTSNGDLISEKEKGRPTSPISMEYVLTNTGSASLNWTAIANVGWVDVSASSGSLAGGQQTNIVVSLNAEAETLPSDIYKGTLSIANQTFGVGQYNKPIRFSVIVRPQNDNFENAQPISSRTGTVSADTRFASEQSGEPKHGDKSTGGKSLWWKWVPDQSGEVIFDLKGSDYDTMMSVYGGHSLARLSALADDDDSGGDLNALVKFTAQAGMTYYIAADGWGKKSGNLKLNWQQSAASPPLLASILPSARSGILNTPLSAFASLINTGSTLANGCFMAIQSGRSEGFGYQETNAQNQPVGAPETPVSIGPGQVQNFVFSIAPDRVLSGEQIGLTFDCANTIPAPSVPGLNRIEISADTVAVPDLVAVAATPDGDGIVNVPGNTGTGVFSVAAVNIGAGGSLTARVDDAQTGLAVQPFICKTNAQGACENDPAAQVDFSLATNEVALFSVFVAGQGNIPFDAANNRLFLRLEQQGVQRGATSVAVRTVVP
jgi:M6 family metalloprotease-like protein